MADNAIDITDTATAIKWSRSLFVKNTFGANLPRHKSRVGVQMSEEVIVVVGQPSPGYSQHMPATGIVYFIECHSQLFDSIPSTSSSGSFNQVIYWRHVDSLLMFRLP